MTLAGPCVCKAAGACTGAVSQACAQLNLLGQGPSVHFRWPAVVILCAWFLVLVTLGSYVR